MYTQAEVIDRLRQAITPYYTASYSNDTDVYSILSTYAGEYVSGSMTLDEIYNDLYIILSTTQKLYDNFGTYVDYPKYFDQDARDDRYDQKSGSLPSYQKNVDFLIDGHLHGSTIYGISRAVTAYTLINPQINEYYTMPRWKLKDSNWNMAFTGPTFSTPGADPGWRSEEWVGGLASLVSGSGSARANQGGKVVAYYHIEDNAQNNLTLGEYSSEVVR